MNLGKLLGRGVKAIVPIVIAALAQSAADAAAKKLDPKLRKDRL